MDSSKLLQLLKSRKFWAAIVSLIVAIFALEYSDAEQAKMVEAILAVATAIAYIIGTALEDGLSRFNGR